MVGDCIVLRIPELGHDARAGVENPAVSERVALAGALALDAVNLLLQDRPVCPDLPAELLVLDPTFDRVAPQEIDEGGVGVALAGSIDASPANLVELLRLMQQNGSLPAE